MKATVKTEIAVNNLLLLLSAHSAMTFPQQNLLTKQAMHKNLVSQCTQIQITIYKINTCRLKFQLRKGIGLGTTMFFLLSNNQALIMH